MSYSYNNNAINNSRNKDRESNKDFNNKIMLKTSTKKKSSQEDIDDMVNKTYDKIFDVIKNGETLYFLDKSLGLIWNEQTEIVGLVNKGTKIWFNEEDKLFIKFEQDNTEFKQIINNYLH